MIKLKIDIIKILIQLSIHPFTAIGTIRIEFRLYRIKFMLSLKLSVFEFIEFGLLYIPKIICYNIFLIKHRFQICNN